MADPWSGVVAGLGGGALAAALLSDNNGLPAMAMKGVSALDGRDVLESHRFPYLPETINDTISVEYMTKNPPGSSHSLQQWASNGGRVLTFEVRLVRDMEVADEQAKASVATKILPADPDSDIVGAPGRNPNIPYYISWLRSFCYPDFLKDGGYSLIDPPPIALLYAKNLRWNEDGSDVIWAVMNQCDVTYNKAFRSGNPKDVTVSLGFAQVVQNPGASAGSRVRFKTRTDMLKARDAMTVGSTGRKPGVTPIDSTKP